MMMFLEDFIVIYAQDEEWEWDDDVEMEMILRQEDDQVDYLVFHQTPIGFD